MKRLASACGILLVSIVINNVSLAPSLASSEGRTTVNNGIFNESAQLDTSQVICINVSC